MIRGLAFDLEGTVIDLEWAHWQGHLEAAKEAGLSLSFKRAVSEIPSFVGGPDEVVARNIAALCSNEVTADVLLERSRYHFNKLLTSVKAIVPRHGFNNVLMTIVRRGIPLAIGSVTDRALATRIIKNSGLEPYFDNDKVVLRNDVKNVKPAPDIYFRTAQVLGVSPEEQLVFEDSINGVKAAHSACSKVIAVPTLHYSDFTCKLLKAGAWTVFRAWNEMNINGVLDNLNDSLKEGLTNAKQRCSRLND
jgi:beta-phosphoglucomutase